MFYSGRVGFGFGTGVNWEVFRVVEDIGVEEDEWEGEEEDEGLR